MITVTGATGHLGNNLVRALTGQGQKVRCVILPGESRASLDGLDVDIVEGDVRNLELLCRVFHGSRIVFHLASVISLLPGSSRLLEDVNVTGAENVAKACLRAGVDRLVYTSSIHALVEPPEGVVIDESMPCDPGQIKMAYSKSKAKGTLRVLDVMSEGLDAVIVMPTGIIGPNDYKPSETGRLIIDYALGKIPARVTGGYDFVDVRDVANGHILAAEKGKPGEKYILSGEWISMDEIMKVISLAASVRFPRLKVPVGVASALAAVFTGYSALTGKSVLLNRDSVDTLKSNSAISSAKAREELGYSSRPIRKSVQDTVKWFQDQGVIPI